MVWKQKILFTTPKRKYIGGSGFMVLALLVSESATAVVVVVVVVVVVMIELLKCYCCWARTTCIMSPRPSIYPLYTQREGYPE